MTREIEGIHHITSMASDALATDHFFTRTLGMRRVKKTVNFDAPDVYHLYYGDEQGVPGTVMTYFPFPDIAPGRRGTGEVGTTVFSVPPGSLDFWESRLRDAEVAGLSPVSHFGEARLTFAGPDGDGFALAESAGDHRAPWLGAGIDAAHAIRGFHSASLVLQDVTATAELLQAMGFAPAGHEGAISRFVLSEGNGAQIIDIEARSDLPKARQGAGSVHHIAFSVADRAAQMRVREMLTERGHQVTPQIDRDYFYAIYFRTPGGVLFEIATAEPGFARDEDPAHLGEALKLPRQHEHLRARLETHLPPIGA